MNQSPFVIMGPTSSSEFGNSLEVCPWITDGDIFFQDFFM